MGLNESWSVPILVLKHLSHPYGNLYNNFFMNNIQSDSTEIVFSKYEDRAEYWDQQVAIRIYLYMLDVRWSGCFKTLCDSKF